MEHLLDQTAITYPWTTLTEMSGEIVKTILEDVADNLFNPDPTASKDDDRGAVGGLQYTCDPNAAIGGRIDNMMLKGKAIEAGKTYKVAGWAPVSKRQRIPARGVGRGRQLPARAEGGQPAFTSCRRSRAWKATPALAIWALRPTASPRCRQGPPP